MKFKVMKEGTLTEVIHLSRNELMDIIDTLYYYLGDNIKYILDKHNASADDSGKEGYLQTMSDDDMRNAFYEIKRFVIDKYSEYNYEECPTAVIDLLKLETVNESKELNEDSLDEGQFSQRLTKSLKNKINSIIDYYSEVVNELTTELKAIEGFKSCSTLGFDGVRWALDRNNTTTTISYNFSHSVDKKRVMRTVQNIINGTDIEIESFEEVFYPNYFKPRLIGDWVTKLTLELPLVDIELQESVENNDESINEGEDMKFKLVEATESEKVLAYKDQIKNCKSWEDLQELSIKIKNDSMLSADEEYNLRFDVAEKNKEFNLNENKESKICCICKKPFNGYGNNAEPVCSGSCCDECNMKEVIPARMNMFKKPSKNESYDTEGLSEYELLNLPVGTKVELEDMQGRKYIGYVLGEGDPEAKTVRITFDETERYDSETRAQEISIWDISKVFDDFDESLNEALEDYKITYYLATATAERRPETIEDVEDDWKEEVFAADSDYDACRYAFSIIHDIAEEEVDDYLADYDIKDVKEFAEYCEEKDLGDGSAFVVKLEGPNGVIYDMGYDKQSYIDEFVSEDSYDDDFNESYYQLSRDDFTVHYLGQNENLWDELIDKDDDDELDNYLVDWFEEHGYYHVTGGGDSYIDNEWVNSLQEFNELCFGDEYYEEEFDESLNEAIDPSKALELKKNSDADVIFYGWQYKNEQPNEIEPEPLTSEEYEARKNRIINDYSDHETKKIVKEPDFTFYALYNRKNEELNEANIHMSKAQMAKLDKDVEDAQREVGKYKIRMKSQKNSDGSVVNVPDFAEVPENELDAAKKAYDRYQKALAARPDRAKNVISYDESLEKVTMKMNELFGFPKKVSGKELEKIATRLEQVINEEGGAFKWFGPEIKDGKINIYFEDAPKGERYYKYLVQDALEKIGITAKVFDIKYYREQEVCDIYLSDLVVSKNKKGIKEDIEKVTLEVQFEEYERYGGGNIRKAKVSGANLLEALKKMVDRMRLYLDSDEIEEKDMTAEEVLRRIAGENGDGCDYIFYIKNVTTGENLLTFNYDEEENWDDDYDDSDNHYQNDYDDDLGFEEIEESFTNSNEVKRMKALHGLD